jgi:hypothetical protein
LEDIMHKGLQLVWNNPNPAPRERLSAGLLGRLTEVLIGCMRRGEIHVARHLVAVYALSPFAVVAARMSRAGIPEDAVLKLV